MLPLHLNNFERSAKLNVLASSTQYRICVIGLGNRLVSSMSSYTTSPVESRAQGVSMFSVENGFEQIDQFEDNQIERKDDESDFGLLDEDDPSSSNQSEAILLELRNNLMRSNVETPISKCTEARTLATSPITIGDQNRLTDQGFFETLLNRRLGLIVGCCLGIFVFFIIVSILGWLKLKKRRQEIAKRAEQQPSQLNYQHLNHPHMNQMHTHPPPDYNTAYRQMASSYEDEDYPQTTVPMQTALPNIQQQHSCHSHTHPNCISGVVVGTTTIGC